MSPATPVPILRGMYSTTQSHAFETTHTRVGYPMPGTAQRLVLTDALGVTTVWHRISDCGHVGRKAAAPLTMLSPAERGVVVLLAEGLTNREIAARLYVSHRTVDTHVSHALAKFGVSSRVQLAGLIREGQR